VVHDATNSRRKNDFFPQLVVRVISPFGRKGNAFATIKIYNYLFVLFLVNDTSVRFDVFRVFALNVGSYPVLLRVTLWLNLEFCLSLLM
jgi:hypothetical protein